MGRQEAGGGEVGRWGGRRHEVGGGEVGRRGGPLLLRRELRHVFDPVAVGVNEVVLLGS